MLCCCQHLQFGFQWLPILTGDHWLDVATGSQFQLNVTCCQLILAANLT